jgi:hypothetical protein
MKTATLAGCDRNLFSHVSVEKKVKVCGKKVCKGSFLSFCNVGYGQLNTLETLPMRIFVVCKLMICPSVVKENK